ncbi:hypothetical protein [Pseudomonas fluorescens]|uniref:Invasin n=1 Tax=Pseudomonas fluorescens TaxID=294 RepID=A0A5E7HET2_PSEFL|nr:hypothetical protein [Pseudomonas fluorescens]VVO62545.1 hypothetical protein PS880_00878 [Pseudomonas fluorescens]
MQRLKNYPVRHGVTIGLPLVLLLTLSPLASGVELMMTTTPVKGVAPIATNVLINNQSSPGSDPIVGNVMQVGYTFSDADGDGESGTTFQWHRAGSAIGGATASSYTTQNADGGTSLTVGVTPRTDASTTDPSVGVVVFSPAVTVAPLRGVALYIHPDTQRRTWGVANSYCQSLGARLPSEIELKTLYVDATSATGVGQSNSEMCSSHGWPLDGQCGGSENNYWSDTQSYGTGGYRSIALDTGNTGLNSAESVNGGVLYHVACIR